ncbi:protein SUPPRESSOR OF PHYA-105 1-like isoform X2 [Carica papaya]|uniref:protein SUPPRESSOR OF PHYA-105 1-like isoform X2 n=1 Tax=Carica papaya TaxID=3649 RepID=UPI000B8CED96|nr:protein SUPPRESSOR OF PHYA-105 1-like isoform X2 [Carica papaya]
MEGFEDKVATNDMTRNMELIQKQCNLPLKAEGHVMMESPVMCESLTSHWPQNSPHKCADITEDLDLSRCVTSFGGSEPPHTSPYSVENIETGTAVADLGVDHTSNLALLNTTIGPRHSQLKHIYHLAGASRCKVYDGDSLPQKMDKILVRVREQLARVPLDKQSLNTFTSKQNDRNLEGISAYLRATSKKNISGDGLPTAAVHLKTLSASNFSILCAKRTSKGKGVVSIDPETPCELDKGIVGQNDDRMNCMAKIVSDGLLNSSAKSDKISLHRINVSADRSFHDGISLREWLKPGAHRKDKSKSLLLFRQIVELVDSAHSQGLVLQELRPCYFNLLSSNKIIYTGSSIKDPDSSVDQDLNRKRPLEKDTCANLRSAKQQKISKETKSTSYQPTNLNCRSKNRTNDGIVYFNADMQDSDYGEHHDQVNYNYPSTSSTTRQQSISETSHLEEKWYACPEELAERGCTFPSNAYGLGVLLFEFLCCFEPRETYPAIMSDLRHRILPPSFLSENPREAGFCLWLLHPEPFSRPTTRYCLAWQMHMAMLAGYLGRDITIPLVQGNT